MDLNARDIHEKQFHDAWRGYNQEEVDDFLDRVADVLDRTQRDNDALSARLAEVESSLAQARQGEEMLKKTLVGAQKAAEEQLARAKARAEQIVREGEDRAKSAAEAARERAREIESGARARAEEREAKATRSAHEVERALEHTKREIESNIERLKAFETDIKQKLRAFLDQQSRSLAALTEHRAMRHHAGQRPSPPARAPVERADRVESSTGEDALDALRERDGRDAAPVEEEANGPLGDYNPPDHEDDELDDLEPSEPVFGPQKRGLRSLFHRED